LAVVAFFEVGLNNIPVSIEVFRWIDSESLNVSWGFHFDSLTVSMLIPVLIVSSLVHVYSIGYMSEDPRGCVEGKRSYGDKLSNSGDLLKLKIPSCSRKAISGWTNYSGKVTSFKICENKMDYRGSKSTILNVVKEQRVDDSWLVKSNLTDLRCTLKGFEKNRGINHGFNLLKGWSSRVKIPSKQFSLDPVAPLRGYVSLSYLGGKWREGKVNYSTSTSVNPGIWSGLIDGEGSFSIILVKNPTRKLGWRVEPKFQLGLHRKDYDVLSQLHLFLGGAGAIYFARKGEFVNYIISSIKDLNKLILHLEKYPLLTQKSADLFLFKQILDLINNKAHLTVEGLNKIVNLKASMNLGLSDKLKSEFPGYRAVERPVINCDNAIINPSWLSGFVSAEGNFDVRTPKTNSKTFPVASMVRQLPLGAQLHRSRKSSGLLSIWKIFNITVYIAELSDKDRASLHNVKIPSNQFCLIASPLRRRRAGLPVIIHSSVAACRNFSCHKSKIVGTNYLSRSLTTYAPNLYLDPWFITGLTDAEGCFMVKIVKNKELRVGWRILLNFQISLHEKDIVLLEKVKSYFKVGHIHKDREYSVYKISSREDLSILVDHFRNYPLRTQKFADYVIFKQILDVINCKAHLTKEGLQEIVNLRAFLNKGLPLELNKAFPETIPVPRPLVNDQEIKEPYWLAGFTSGDGCFMVKVSKSRLYKAGGQVSLLYILTQHSRDSKLMKSLTHYFSCGRYKLHPHRDTGEFIVTDFSSIVNIIIPFFKKYPLEGVKALDFFDFCQIANIMKVKGHLTKPGLEEIISLKEKMNTKREVKLP